MHWAQWSHRRRMPEMESTLIIQTVPPRHKIDGRRSSEHPSRKRGRLPIVIGIKPVGIVEIRLRKEVGPALSQVFQMAPYKSQVKTFQAVKKHQPKREDHTTAHLVVTAEDNVASQFSQLNQIKSKYMKTSKRTSKTQRRKPRIPQSVKCSDPKPEIRNWPRWLKTRQ